MRDPRHPRQIPTTPDPALFTDSPQPQDIPPTVRITGAPRPSSLDKSPHPHCPDRKGGTRW
jgi:hypothetical protein